MPLHRQPRQRNTNRHIRRNVRIIPHNKTGLDNRKVKNIPNNKIGRSHKRRIGSIRSNRRSIRRRVNLSHRFNSRGGHNNSRKNPIGTRC